MIRHSVDNEGIATLEWDLPDRSQNVINDESAAAFHAALERSLGDSDVKGVLIASGKRDFIAGGDLEMFLRDSGGETAFLRNRHWHGCLREMETSGKPVAAALNGSALGGGLELSLACHYRVAADNPRARFGLVEVNVGLLPGGGGTQRLPRLIGIQQALPLMLEGSRLTARDALKLGIVHAVVAPGEEREAAKRWLLGTGQQQARQPWDTRGYRVPGGAVQSPSGLRTFMVGNAMLREKTFDNYPAARNIMSCVYEGLQTDIDTGLRIESRYFAATLSTPEAKNMIRVLFFGMNDARRLAGRPKHVPVAKFVKVGMLGAGMMGAAIAYCCAAAGIDTVLIDTDQPLADKGKDYSRGLVDKQAARGKLSREKADAVLDRIDTTADLSRLDGCQLVIEAVFEDRKLKADVTRRAEAALGGDSIFASNTSTLPIAGLAQASSRPANFIGLHFFSPADRMPLVEIIVAKETSRETLARSMDFVQALGKIPIVVNDSRGFYTSRVFGTYLAEGMTLLAEGVAPALIDNAGCMAGMPLGPLALTDEVSIDLVWKIGKQTQADLGEAYLAKPADAVVQLMVEKFGRLGKKIGKGFYDYPAEGRKSLWPGLMEHFPPAPHQPDVKQVIERLVLIQSVEAARCLEEKVLQRPIDGDVGAILGWGYPAFRGGPLSWIHTMSIMTFLAACERLAAAHGPRFAAPPSLYGMAARGETIYPA